MTAKPQPSSFLTKEFLSKISHHSRSPFNGLLGFSELLLLNQHRLNADDSTEYLMRINMLGKKAFISAENTVLLLKIISGNIQAQSNTLLLQPVIDHSYNLNKEGIKLKQLEFTSEVEPHFSFTGDLFLMNSIFSNLLAKAVKLCDDESEVSLSAKTVKKKKMISVTYTGMPVESEVVRDFFSKPKPGSPLFPPELDVELWICYEVAKLQDMTFNVLFPKVNKTTFVLEVH